MRACNALPIDQLLSLRDGHPVDATALAHLEGCSSCGKELERLRSLRFALKALPDISPPPYDGAGIRARLRSSRVYRAATAAAAAGVGALTLAVITFVSSPRSNEISDDTSTVATTTGTSDVVPNVNSLVIRSQELDSRLQRLPHRPQIQRASTSATIDTLQNRIQWVDYQLSMAHEAGMTERQSAELWENRIQLMDSLLKVRYVEAQRAATVFTGSFRSSL